MSSGRSTCLEVGELHAHPRRLATGARISAAIARRRPYFEPYNSNQAKRFDSSLVFHCAMLSPVQLPGCVPAPPGAIAWEEGPEGDPLVQVGCRTARWVPGGAGRGGAGRATMLPDMQLTGLEAPRHCTSTAVAGTLPK